MFFIIPTLTSKDVIDSKNINMVFMNMDLRENGEDKNDSYVIVNAMWGLGDTVYSSAVMKPLYSEIKEPFYVITPLPQLFSQFDFVKCIKPKEINLRTQKKNSEKVDPKYWNNLPDISTDKRQRVNLDINYYRRWGGDENWNVLDNMMMPIISGTQLAWDLRRYPYEISLPRFDVELPDWANSGFILVRPNVIRKEWQASARNCKPIYLKELCNVAKQKLKVPVVSFADCDGDKEWIEKEVPCDYKYHEGQFSLEQICELVHRATLTVGSQGFIAPFSMAAQTKCVIILGGCGYDNHPKRLLHEKLSTPNITYVMPENMCMCWDYKHDQCNKRILNPVSIFNTILEKYFG
jgi:hypothetical protein